MANKKRINKTKLARTAIVALLAVILIIAAAYIVKNNLLKGDYPADPAEILSRPPSAVLLERGVVIDAGHGGSDPGAVSTVTGAYEDDINLAVANILKAELESRGIPVIMTRASEDAIAPTKDEDMAKRRSIIHESNAAAMISIHQNSFPDNTDVWGPQTHYQKGSRDSSALASAIQAQMNRTTNGTRGTYSDNLYVLKGDPMPAVLVECGFLTNDGEAKRLMDDGYRKELCLAITAGLLSYFD